MRKRPEDADGFAGLNQKRFVVFKITKRLDYCPVGVPASRRPAGSAIDNQFSWILRNFLVKVVHQHPHGGFLMPTFAGNCRASRRTDWCVIHTCSSARWMK